MSDAKSPDSQPGVEHEQADSRRHLRKHVCTTLRGYVAKHGQEKIVVQAGKDDDEREKLLEPVLVDLQWVSNGLNAAVDGRIRNLETFGGPVELLGRLGVQAAANPCLSDYSQSSMCPQRSGQRSARCWDESFSGCSTWKGSASSD